MAPPSARSQRLCVNTIQRFDKETESGEAARRRRMLRAGALSKSRGCCEGDTTSECSHDPKKTEPRKKRRGTKQREIKTQHNFRACIVFTFQPICFLLVSVLILCWFTFPNASLCACSRHPFKISVKPASSGWYGHNFGTWTRNDKLMSLQKKELKKERDVEKTRTVSNKALRWWLIFQGKCVRRPLPRLQRSLDYFFQSRII